MDYRQIVLGWRDRRIDSLEKLEEALSNFRILFAYHSGVIENPSVTYHNTREIFENGMVINYTGDLRTLYEIQNQKLCYEYLKPLILAREPVSSSLIKEIHKILMQGTYDEGRWSRGERPGQFKIHDYPPIVVHNESKDLYYKALGHYDETGEIEQFADYMKVRLEQTWERRRARGEKLENLLE